MSNVKLSVVVPTYNRKYFLSQCINSLLLSVLGYEEVVEIIISDNASEDGTVEVVNKKYGSFHFVKYFRNKSNIGPESNFLLSLQRANGKYCLVLGDDDAVTNDFFKIILSAIEHGSDLYLLNYTSYDKNLQNIILKENLLSNKLFYSDKDDVLYQFGPKPSFISSAIIKRESLDWCNLEIYSEFNKYGFSFLYLIYSSINSNNVVPCKVEYIQKPCILQRSDNSCLADVYDEWFFEGQALVFDQLYKEGYSRKSINKAKSLTLSTYAFFRIKDLKLNQLDLTSYRYYLVKHYKIFFRTWLLFLPLSFLPSVLFVVLRKVKNIFR